MELNLAIRGNLKPFLDAVGESGARAVTEVIKEITDEAKSTLRQQVESSGLGSRLSRTWQSKQFPNGKPSMNAKGLIFNKAPQIIDAFDKGATIRSSSGFYLVIPTEAAGKGFRKRMTPEQWEQRHGQALRFVYVNSKVSLLVAENFRASGGKRGGFRKASASALRTGRGLTTVVMFILVKQVSLKKRLNIEAAVNRFQSDLPRRIAARWEDKIKSAQNQFGANE